MKNNLWVSIKKQGLTVDKTTNVNISPAIKAKIKRSEVDFETIEVVLEREVSLEEYQQGLIGKYKDELVSNLRRFLGIYAIKHNLSIIIDPAEVRTNEAELYGSFRSFCKINNLKPLMKPTGGRIEFVYEKLNSKNIKELSKQNFILDPYLASGIDWFNTGLIQNYSSNKFLHFFIPLEILAGRFVTDSKIKWKNEHLADYKGIQYFLRKVLKPVDENMFLRLMNDLAKFSFPDQIKRYFGAIFSSKELSNFWGNDSDITFNGKHQWKIYRLMSKQAATKEQATIFKVMQKLYKIRNDIVHNGLVDIASEDIFVLENILRRVIKKELQK